MVHGFRKMLLRIILRVLANALLLYVIAFLVPGISYSGDWITLIFAGLVLGVINLFIKPIVVFISFPLIFLTLGLFFFIINGLMLWLVSLFIPEFHIGGIFPFLLGSVLFTFLNLLVNWMMPKKRKKSY